MARLVSLSVLIAAIAGLGIMFFQVVAPFLLPLFLAAVAAVLLTPWFEDIRRRLGGKTRVAAGITTAIVVTLFLLPATAIVVLGVAQAFSFTVSTGVDEVRETVDRSIDWTAKLMAGRESWLPSGLRAPETKDVDGLIVALETDLVDLNSKIDTGTLSIDDESTLYDRIRDREHRIADLQLLRAADADEGRVEYYRHRVSDTLNDLRNSADDQLFGVARRTVGGTLGIVGQTVGVIVGGIITFFIFAVALYYFLADGPALIEGAESLIPVQVDYQRELLHEFGKVVRSVVLATFMAAIAQGIAIAFALLLTGFDHIILLLIASIISALIPLAGTWLVWVPCAIILCIEGQYTSAALLALWGSIFVGTLDNVIRAYVLNNDTKLHPLLALIAVLGGLQVMGIWGVFIGPIVASCLHALVKIFNHELTELSHEKFGDVATNALSAAPTERPNTERPTTERPPSSQVAPILQNPGEPHANGVEATPESSVSSDAMTTSKPVSATEKAPIDGSHPSASTPPDANGGIDTSAGQDTND